MSAMKDFDAQYRYVRRQLLNGSNPFVTQASMREWLKLRSEEVIRQTCEERWKMAKRQLRGSVSRENEWPFTQNLPPAPNDEEL